MTINTNAAKEILFPVVAASLTSLASEVFPARNLNIALEQVSQLASPLSQPTIEPPLDQQSRQESFTKAPFLPESGFSGRVEITSFSRSFTDDFEELKVGIKETATDLERNLVVQIGRDKDNHKILAHKFSEDSGWVLAVGNESNVPVWFIDAALKSNAFASLAKRHGNGMAVTIEVRTIYEPKNSELGPDRSSLPDETVHKRLNAKKIVNIDGRSTIKGQYLVVTLGKELSREDRESLQLLVRDLVRFYQKLERIDRVSKSDNFRDPAKILNWCIRDISGKDPRLMTRELDERLKLELIKLSKGAEKHNDNQ